ncbi:MAG: hypothetical protein JSV99_08205 [Planctomycetota bacterium]|nr:MAG: hypothetical protein JSV99_08205 [Planctomycetota bacterium]
MEGRVKGKSICGRVVVFGAVVVWLFLAHICEARIIIVNDDGPADFNNIQAAIDDSNDGDLVVVLPGTYRGDGNRDISFLGKAITVQGVEPNDPDIVAATVIDCNATNLDRHRGFLFENGEDANSILAGITIKNGYTPYHSPANYSGGGILCYGSSPTITRCVLRGNQAKYGGGIYCRDGNPNINNCDISFNRGLEAGGGVYCSSERAAITNCVLRNNVSDSGGGISLSGESPRVEICKIIGNEATYSGSGVRSYASSPVISNCVITENQSGHFGTAIGYGGSPRIINCTIVNNLSEYSTGGIEGGSEGSEAVIVNCIIWGNTGRQIYVRWGLITVAFSNVEGGEGEVFVHPGAALEWAEGNIDAEPGLAFSNGFRLMAGSACIDGGTNDPCGGLAETDIEGVSRRLDGNVDGNAVADMGACEYDGERARIAINASDFALTHFLGEPNHIEERLLLRNSGCCRLSWEIFEDCPWLEVSPREGWSDGEIDEVMITVDTSDLSAGDYSCTLTVSDPAAINTPRDVRVELSVRTRHYVPSQYLTIQAGIDAAVDGDEVVVSPGIYRGDGNRDIEFLGKAITVRSTEPGERGVVAATIIDCQGREDEHHRGFNFDNAEYRDSVLDGFTITNGYASEGGAIRCGNDSDPTISNCMIVGNRADVNGPEGGGGGGIYCRYSYPTISRCIISGNEAAISGGGICCYWSFPIVTNCVIVNNWARGGGDGGGVFCNWSGSRFKNCTFLGNRADRGGAICCWQNSSVKLRNCILWSNVANRGNEVSLGIGWGGEWSGSGLIASYSDVPTGYSNIYVDEGSTVNWEEGNIEVDPCFAFAGDVYISSESACVDAGTNEPEGGLPLTDIEGVPRVLDGDGDGNAVVDMGAYEYTTEARIFASPRALIFYGPAGGPNPAEQILDLAGAGGGAVNWEVVEDCSWLTAWPVSGSSSGEIDELNIQVDTTGLEPGSYSCAIKVRDQEAINTPVQVVVLLIVGIVRNVPSEYGTIQEAIDDCNDGDGVKVAPGRYAGDGNRDIDYGGKSITVFSTDPSDPNIVAGTVIDCEGSEEDMHRGFIFENGENGNSVIDGFTITNGCTTQGGAINFWESGATIRNCILSENRATYVGGAVHSIWGNINISRCVIAHNTSGRHSGAIYCGGGALSVDRSVVTGNSAEEYCGGISFGRGSSVITNSVVSGNRAAYIGGFSCFQSDSVIRNCIITGNVGEEESGGLHSSRSNVVVQNSIIWDNTSAKGREITLEGKESYLCYLTVLHSDVRGGAAEISSDSNSVVVWGEGNIDLDPCFVEAGYWDANGTEGDVNDDFWVEGDNHLLAGSPCIDSGDPNYVAGPNETDIDGEPRVMGGRVDMGVDEVAVLSIDLNMGEQWMYQNLPGQSNSDLTAGVSVTDDPMGNTTYSYEWEIVLPGDVSLAPVTVEGGGAGDAYWRFAARGCDEPGGLSDSGQTFTVRVIITGDDYGNTGVAEAEFGIALLGDINNDGWVNVADRSITNAFWRTGSAGPYTLKDCDVNCDGVVNVADRSIANAVWRGILGQNSVSSPCPLR